MAALMLVATQSATSLADGGTIRLGIDDAVGMMRRQNPELLAGLLKVRSASGDVTTARLYPNPVLSLGAGNFAIGQTNPNGLSPGETVESQAGLSQELVLWGKRGARIDEAVRHEAGAEAEHADLDRSLVFELRSRFVDVQVATERLRLARENLDHYRDTVRLAEVRARSGDISPAERDKVALELRGFERDEADAEVARREAVGELLPMLGVDATDVETTGPLRLGDEPADAATLVAHALASRPDLRGAEREVEAADAALRRARAEAWPNVTVGVQYSHSEFLVSGDLANQVGATFSLPLPVVDRNQGEIEKAEAEAGIARHEAQKLRLEIPQQVAAARVRYDAARGRVRRFDDTFLAQATEARHAAEVAYREGSVGLLELLEAERTYVETERDYLDALHDGVVAGWDVVRAAALEVSE
jgi:cobalt-zinc-cadmium efflux system outer membrane protein